MLNPGRDVGPVFVHGISNSEVQDAPRFEDVAGELLARMDGAIVVAHNAVFEERFLAAEFDRAGIAVPVSPAVCSLWLARRTLRASNHKLTTLARAAGLSTVDAHAALADVRTVAALMPRMLALHGEPLRFLTGFRPMPLLPRDVRPKTRAAALRKGTDGWMASLMSRLPLSATEASEADAQRYLDALADALEDGRILGGEAQILARLAGSAGLGARAGRRPARPVPRVPAVGRARRLHPHDRRDPAAAHDRARSRAARLLRRPQADLAGRSRRRAGRRPDAARGAAVHPLPPPRTRPRDLPGAGLIGGETVDGGRGAVTGW